MWVDEELGAAFLNTENTAAINSMGTLKEKQELIKSKKMVKQGEGLRQYYMQHRHDLQLQVQQRHTLTASRLRAMI
ncbi:hypothetical protein SUGI_1173080 [Cryptomeria japonica]|nr:hypothetical protein SUGI_1173080 [Cryptomeria japonica]